MKKVRLKWARNRGLDNIIARDTDVKACIFLLETVSRLSSLSSSSSIPAPAPVAIRSLSGLQKPLGLTFPVLRFLRRYPNLFPEAPHPRFTSVPSFTLSPISTLLLDQLSLAADPSTSDSHRRLERLLLMCRSRCLPLSAIFPLRYDLGLPSDFPLSFPRAYPDMFALSGTGASTKLCLNSLPDELPLSSLQQRHASKMEKTGLSYQQLNAPMELPMRFPRGYGGMNKVKAWMAEFHRLPYISPYQEYCGIEPESDIAEKRAVGVLHELLSLMVHKKTKRNYLRGLREELGLPHRFTRLFTRYPGVFYLSLKCKTTTVVLREGYEKGKLVEASRLTELRSKVNYVMRTGILYRAKGLSKLVLEEGIPEAVDNGSGRAEEPEEEDVEDFEFEVSDGSCSDEEDEEDDDDD